MESFILISIVSSLSIVVLTHVFLSVAKSLLYPFNLDKKKLARSSELEGATFSSSNWPGLLGTNEANIDFHRTVLFT
jgi:hypothetical protein